MKTLERLLLADSVLQELIEQGVVTEEEVQEIAEEQAETSAEHIKNFKEQMELQE